jgi:dolichol-phosphate mannosyltransferase
MDISVVIPARREGPNLALLLPAIRQVLDALGISSELLIVTDEPDPATVEAAERAHAEIIVQEEPGYGGALLGGFARARGAYLLTMDADLSHGPEFIRALWAQRKHAELSIASRYVSGGQAVMPWHRILLSRALNEVYRRVFAVPVHDLSSGFRLYDASILHQQTYAGRDFDVLLEILIRAYAAGSRIQEIPFVYAPRRHGSSNARVLRVGRAYLKSFGALWKIRISRAARAGLLRTRRTPGVV